MICMRHYNYKINIFLYLQTPSISYSFQSSLNKSEYHEDTIRISWRTTKLALTCETISCTSIPRVKLRITLTYTATSYHDRATNSGLVWSFRGRWRFWRSWRNSQVAKCCATTQHPRFCIPHSCFLVDAVGDHANFELEKCRWRRSENCIQLREWDR